MDDVYYEIPGEVEPSTHVTVASEVCLADWVNAPDAGVFLESVLDDIRGQMQTLWASCKDKLVRCDAPAPTALSNITKES